MRLRGAAAAAAMGLAACGGVRVADLSAPQPAPEGSCVVVGLLGGLDAWDDESKGVRRLALTLRDPAEGRYAETFENRRAGLAREFVVRTFDAGRDATPAGSRDVRVVVYGQSLGGMAAVGLARALERDGVTVDLLVLIDSVGPGDGTIPGNVRQVANLFQDDGRIIRGQHPIAAADPAATRVIGEWEYEYDEPPGSGIDVGDLSWHKRAFRVAHAKMDRDPRVWERVESLVRSACG